MIRIVLVDDHRILTESLCHALDADPGIEVVATAATYGAAVDAIRAHTPDVAIVDIRLPDGSGLELVRSLPDTPCIILSTFGGPAYVESALRVGARGFFLKTSPTAVLQDGIRRVVDGGSAFDQDAMTVGAPTRWRPLSERELGLVRLVMDGRSNDEIARTLGIARKTVEAHLNRLFDKFSVASRTELAMKSEREGWLDLPVDR